MFARFANSVGDRLRDQARWVMGHSCVGQLATAAAARPSPASSCFRIPINVRFIDLGRHLLQEGEHQGTLPPASGFHLKQEGEH